MWRSTIGSSMASFYDLLKVTWWQLMSHLWLVCSKLSIAVSWLDWWKPDLDSSDWLMAVWGSGICLLLRKHPRPSFSTGFPIFFFYFPRWGFDVDWFVRSRLHRAFWFSHHFAISTCFPLNVPKYWMLLRSVISWACVQLFLWKYCIEVFMRCGKPSDDLANQ